jgi:hypothetical protein
VEMAGPISKVARASEGLHDWKIGEVGREVAMGFLDALAVAGWSPTTTTASAIWNAHGMRKKESGVAWRICSGDGDGEYVKEGAGDIEHVDTHRPWSSCRDLWEDRGNGKQGGE